MAAISCTDPRRYLEMNKSTVLTEMCRSNSLGSQLRSDPKTLIGHETDNYNDLYYRT